MPACRWPTGALERNLVRFRHVPYVHSDTMIRFAVIALLALAPLAAVAAPCYQLSNDKARLACYNRMAACFGIEDSNAKLKCLDEKIRNGSKAEASASAPGQPAPDVARFGLAPKEPDAMTSTITSIRRRFDGVDFLTLANHQVWRETEDQTSFFRVGQHVTIKPSILGSFSLFCDKCRGINRLIKVHRVK